MTPIIGPDSASEKGINDAASVLTSMESKYYCERLKGINNGTDLVILYISQIFSFNETTHIKSLSIASQYIDNSILTQNRHLNVY